MRGDRRGTCRARRAPPVVGRRARAGSAAARLASSRTQELEALALRPSRRTSRARARVVIASSASVCRAASCRMSSRASVRPNAATPAQHVGQPAVGDDGVAGLVRASRWQSRQRLGEMPRVEVDVGARRCGHARRHRATASIHGRVARSRVADVAQQLAVRLARVADARRAAPALATRHRQLVAQRVDLVEVEVRRHPARQQAGCAGHLGRDVRVAVAIAADPRAEADRRGVERQPPAGRRLAARDRAARR